MDHPRAAFGVTPFKGAESAARQSRSGGSLAWASLAWKRC